MTINHYAEAEKFLARADELAVETDDYCLAAAYVHATLAVADVVALAAQPQRWATSILDPSGPQ